MHTDTPSNQNDSSVSDTGNAELYLLDCKLGRILVQLFFLSHVGHVLLQRAQPSYPALGLSLAGAHQVQALPGPSEDHGEALLVVHGRRQTPQRLRLAAFADALDLGGGDCEWKAKGK